MWIFDYNMESRWRTIDKQYADMMIKLITALKWLHERKFCLSIQRFVMQSGKHDLKLSIELYLVILEGLKTGESGASMGNKYGFCKSTISSVKRDMEMPP
uniref:HTH psq-type domain-containing protein n=1 Tax=Trichuris muris TaxID=70415 RepID=A0A5S6QL47_TRIMR